MKEIRQWLAALKLEKYTGAFERAEIDAETLPELIEDDLREIGLPVGPRRKVLSALRQLNEAKNLSEVTASAGKGGEIAEGSRAVVYAERRQLTILFCDLVGSTALSANLDPEDMRDVIRGYQDTCAGVITRFDGFVAKFMGDGVLAYFGWPKAHEDEAERAVRAGLALIEAVKLLKAPGGQQLEARVGVATGLVVVGDLIGEGASQEQSVVGDAPNLAARLQTLAKPNQLIIAHQTVKLIGNSFVAETIGLQKIKGFDEAVEAFLVIGERIVESRFEAKKGKLLSLVGRDQELALLRERWKRASCGEGQGVLLVGEAGIGKSRIIRAFVDELKAGSCTRIHYQCSPNHRDSALWPVIQQLTYVIDLAPPFAQYNKLERLRSLFAQVVDESTVAVLADLLGVECKTPCENQELTPEEKRTKTLDALVAQLIALAAEQPVLVVVEDAHWIDPTTLQLLELCLDQIYSSRALLLLTSRPDDQPELAAHPHLSRLTLNRLGRAGVKKIISQLGGDQIASESIELIISRTDGVPLFVEELTRTVLDSKDTRVPSSLHDSLMSRLDRTPEVKEIAQLAACIGREFNAALLKSISGRNADSVDEALIRLTDTQIIFKRGGNSLGKYIFKHALVRDAAYESLLKQSAKQIHRRIACTLVSESPVTTNVAHDLISNHFLAADCKREALPHLIAASQSASKGYAYPEALSWLNKALPILVEFDDDQDLKKSKLELYSTLTPILMATKGYAHPDTVAAAELAIRYCKDLNDIERLLPMLFARLSAYTAAGDVLSAVSFADQIRKIGEARQKQIALVVGHRSTGFCQLWQGQILNAAESFKAALDFAKDLPAEDYDGSFGQHPATTALLLLGFTRHLQGGIETSDRLVSEAAHRATTLKHPLTSAYISLFQCLIFADRRDLKGLKGVAAAFRTLCSVHNVKQWHYLGEFYLTFADYYEDPADGKIDLMGELLEEHRALGFGLNYPFFLSLLIDACIDANFLSRANECLDEAHACVRRSGEYWIKPELERLRANVIIKESSTDTANLEKALWRAIENSGKQGNRLTQLRAACDFARVMACAGRKKDGAQLLGSVFSEFKEGFRTPLLLHAGAQLRELQ